MQPSIKEDTVRVQGYGSTHVGRRARNEDAYCTRSELGLFAVADGMGGYEGGQVASRIAIESLTDFFARLGEDADPGFDVRKDGGRTVAACRMEMAIRVTHREVLSRAQDHLAEMGSTLAALLVRQGRALVAHVGDSRVYRMRGGHLEQLTRDHSLCTDLDAQGADAVAASLRPVLTHIVTRALTRDACADPDIRIEQVQPGDRYLLCSDGLTDVLPDEVVRDVLSDTSSDRAADELVTLAYRDGGHDNITAVLVDAGV